MLYFNQQLSQNSEKVTFFIEFSSNILKIFSIFPEYLYCYSKHSKNKAVFKISVDAKIMHILQVSY